MTDNSVESDQTADTSLSAVLDALISHSPFGIAVVDQDYRFIRINSYLTTSIGLQNSSDSDMVGKTVEEVLGKENWQKLRVYYDRALAGETITDVPIQG